MSEFDNNNFNGGENENGTSNDENLNAQQEENLGSQQEEAPNTAQTENNGSQSDYEGSPKESRTPEQPVNNYPPEQNYNGNSAGQRYYYGQNPQPYGRKGSPNYVYYGNNPNRGNYPYQPPYSPQQNMPHNGAEGPDGSFGPNRQNASNKKGKKVFAVCIVSIALISVILIIFTSTGMFSSEKKTEKQKVDAPSLQVSDSSTDSAASVSTGFTAADVYEKVKESSVGVLVYSSNTTVTAGEGSGVIVGEDKTGKYTYIITCAHVVDNSSSVTIQLYDETKCDATVIGADERTDIAVLRIAKTGLKAFEIGDSDKLAVGETVYAIGNPGGVDFAGSFTDGMISAIARPISSEIGYKMICLQHTAAINPGNSGGALVNAKGQLIGINSSKIANTSYEGMGFAVPSKTFTEVYNEIIEHGYVTNRPKLGITYTPASASQTYSMIVGVKGLPKGSIIIQSINVDSSLVGKGVEVGDLITKVNGKELENSDSLPQLIEKSKVGDKLKLTICHIDKNYEIKEFEVETTLVEDKGESDDVEEMTTSAYNWNPFGSYFGN